MDTERIKTLIDAEVEALLSEITELKERIAKLEHESFRRSLNVQQHIGQYIDHEQKGNGPVL
jgi:predicted  nucleic acid-binding Zn-ribbon protein